MFRRTRPPGAAGSFRPAQRQRARSVCRPVDTRQPAGRGHGRARLPARLRRQPGCRPPARDPGSRHPRGAADGGRARNLGRAAGRHHGADTRSAVRRDGQPLAAVSDGVVPVVGEGRLLPGGWRVRVPRSTAGRDGADLGRARDAARSDRARRVAPVRRGRRAALVACARRRRGAHAFLRRPAVAAARLRALPARHRRRRPARRERALHRGRGHPRRRRGRLLRAHRQRPAGLGLRTRRARHRPQPARRRARPAADGHRRLERRHEPRRPRRPRRIGVAGLVPVPACRRLRAAGAPAR